MRAVVEPGSYEACAEQVVADIFQTMLGLEVEATQVIWPPEEPVINATVHYAGPWKGALLLECTAEQALFFTARLMATELPPFINEDVRDALGELANMIAGNLKPLLPRGVALSMPTLVEGTDYAVRVLGGNLAGMVAFRCCVGTFWVTLIESPENQERGCAGLLLQQTS